MTESQDFCTPQEAAKIIGVTDQTIYNWIGAGIFQGVQRKGATMLKRRYRIPRVEVERIKEEGNYTEGNRKAQLVAA